MSHRVFGSGGLEKGLRFQLNPSIDFCCGSYLVDGMSDLCTNVVSARHFLQELSIEVTVKVNQLWSIVCAQSPGTVFRTVAIPRAFRDTFATTRWDIGVRATSCKARNGSPVSQSQSHNSRVLQRAITPSAQRSDRRNPNRPLACICCLVPWR